MATAAPWRPSPACAAGHPLERKAAAGSWFSAPKRCAKCDEALPAGSIRFSCKACGYHLCDKCQAVRAEEMLSEQITLTVYRMAQPGILLGLGGHDEDTLQARIERGATVGALKLQLAALYGLPPAAQVLRRDADGAPLADAELLKYDDGDVVHLCMAGAGGAGGAGGIADMVSSALADAAGAMNAAIAHADEARRQLESVEYELAFLMPVQSSPRKLPERRCKLAVAATARAAEVLEMVKLEFNMEDTELALEFAGEKLPLQASVLTLGLREGDTVLVVPQLPAETSL